VAWIRSEQSLRGHPKTTKLARMLDVSVATAIGHLHMFWWWARDYAKDGDLSQYEAEEIADGCGWVGDSGRLVQALADCGPGEHWGFLEKGARGWVVHDWMEYNGENIRQLEADAARKREARKKPKISGGRPADDRETSDGHPADVRGCGGRTDRQTNKQTNKQTNRVQDAGVARPAEIPAAAAAADNSSIITGESANNKVADPGVTIRHALEKCGMLMPSPFQVEKLTRWLGDGFELPVLVAAIERAEGAGKRRLDYIEGILRRWHVVGVHTMAAVEAEQRARTPTVSTTSAAGEEPSFAADLRRMRAADEARRVAEGTPPPPPDGAPKEWF
jgi:DnaD/phage-associated family protein